MARRRCPPDPVCLPARATIAHNTISNWAHGFIWALIRVPLVLLLFELCD